MGGRRRHQAREARRGAVGSRESSYHPSGRAGGREAAPRVRPGVRVVASTGPRYAGVMDAVHTDEAKARRYHRRQFALTMGDLALGAALLGWWSWSGAAGELARALEFRLRSPAAVVAAMTLALGALQTVVTFPLDLAGGFVLPRRAGLLTQSFWSWLGDR